MPSVSTIPFKSIPHHTKLYLDYLDRDPGVLGFYRHAPTRESLESVARHEISKHPFPREEIVSILERQNRVFGSSPRVLSAIQTLKRRDCAAVVTGQQVGLFSGPLYTIYKAFTAIRLAEELRDRGIPAVPVFWMDSEDHDLAEVTRSRVFGSDHTLHEIDYRPILFGESRIQEESRPVGNLRFDDSILDASKRYLALLADTEWKSQVRDQLETTYRPGASFAEAFGRLLADIFRDFDLILFDALDPDAKRLVTPLFERAISDADHIHDLLRQRNQRLHDSGYHMQVSVLENSTILFLQEGAERRAVVRENGTFGLKNIDGEWTANQLTERLKTAPHLFSPNVLLRPLVQDHLFPTAAYVAGPAEVAYFAQIEVLYSVFDRSMPVIWPRASFTLLEKDVHSELNRYGLEFEECFLGKHHLVEKIVASGNKPESTALLEELQGKLNAGLEVIRPGLEAADGSLGAALNTAKSKMLHQVATLQAKFVHLEARHNQEILDQADRLLNICYPNKNLQEREFGVHYFLSRLGPDSLESVYPAIDLDSFGHRIIRLE